MNILPKTQYHISVLSKRLHKFVFNRSGGAEAYLRDTPLTRVGELQAQLVGEGLRLAGVRPARVYASPALRCVQTAHHMLHGTNTLRSE